MAFLPKVRKKTEQELSLMRITHSPHQFEIVEGLFMTADVYNDLADKFNKAVQKGREHIMYKGKLMLTDFVGFCLHRYDNIDPSFDEQAAAYYAKRIEDAKNGTL
jgi:hypothetical protein